jgi:hyaluronate lyase
MLEKEVVCLGAGIRCDSANSVDTTVENRRMGSSATSVNLWVNGVATSRALNWGTTLTSPKSCAIEGVGGYYFPDGPNNIRAEFVPSSGKWTDIHPSDSDTNTYTENYLRLIFNHGVRPAGATYAYTLLPAMSPSEVAGYANNPQTTILSNTDTVQAVKNPALGIVAANFWNTSGGTADLLTVNKSCSVIVRETFNSVSVGIADPTQSLTGMITVTLNGRTSLGTLSTDSGVTVTGTSPITLSVNVSGSKGKSFNASFSLAPSPVITSNPEMVAINGKPLSFQVTAANNPTSFDATGLPAGLVINALSGVISGTPTQSGTYTATISATNSTGTGYANLTITVAGATSDISYTYNSSTTWTCPANVTAVQVECWGAGGAGGSAQRVGSSGTVQYGGGGAGGAYAKATNITVVPGNIYYANVGTCSSNTSSVTGISVAGGDSWLSESNAPSSLILARGGAGGNSAVGNTTSTAYAAGGGGTTNGSTGSVLYAGGSGANGSQTNATGFGGAGGGGSGAGSSTTGATTTNCVGAIAPSGGGAGGTGPTSGSLSGANGFAPGGGGAGSRNSSGTLTPGASGGAGRVILTVKSTAKVAQAITFTLDPNTAAVGDAVRTLGATSSSGLLVALGSSNPAVATITGGNILNIVGPGTATITATQLGDDSYEAAAPVTRVLTVTAATSGFTTWNGGDSTMTSELLSKYAIGGASNSAAASEQTKVSLTPTLFSLTAVVRTDDPKLTITPKATTSLGGDWDYPVATTGAAQSVSQANVPVGCERKVFTLDRSTNTKVFIKLETGYTP